MNSECTRLHEAFRDLPRHTFRNGYYNPGGPVPLNGIYIMFEKGETSHGGERIVRIGTHTTQNRLLARLLQHFVGSSILRKQIGRIYFRKSKKYLQQWNKDDRAKIPSNLLRRADMYINNHLRNNFTFAVFEEKSPTKRASLEKKLVATIAQCSECKASDNWLGSNYPGGALEKGLWNQHYLKEKAFKPKKLSQFITDHELG